jgi:beta-lactamase regulating signal transducer with metallopeptidase domain
VAYDVFLKKETFFYYNRVYLLVSSLLSLVIPLIKIDSFNQAISNSYFVNLPEVFIGNVNQVTTETNDLTSQMESTLLTITNLYVLVAVLVFAVFLFKLFKIVRLILNSTKTKTENFTIVHLKNTNSAFSFFNYVFLGDTLSETEKQCIIEHEKIHVIEKHTLDLLWFETLKIIFWFNPLIYLYQNRISNIQEFIADQNAIKTNKSQYYQQLLQQVFNVKNCSFINPFFKQSLIKKRIIMLQKSKSKQVKLAKYLLLIPMVLGMLVYTSCVDSNSDNLESTKTQIEIPLLVNQVKEQIAVQGNISNPEEKALDLLFKTMKGKEFDPKLVEEVHQLIGKKDKSKLELKLANVFDAIQIKGNISDVDEIAIKDLLILTVDDSFSDPFFEDALSRVEIPFGVVDQSPVFPGCEDSSKDDQKKCFSDQITKHVANNFNSKSADNLNLNKGVQRIVTTFKINKSGEVSELKVKATHSDLEVEAKRVINSLPKMVPGMHEGKTVNVTYALPINFNIN